MAYDEGLAERMREHFGDDENVSERKMFGGLAFMYDGNMCVGIIGDDLMARVGPDAYEASLKKTGAREMDFTGKALKGFVYVGSEGYEDDDDLAGWIEAAKSFVTSLN